MSGDNHKNTTRIKGKSSNPGPKFKIVSRLDGNLVTDQSKRKKRRMGSASQGRELLLAKVEADMASIRQKQEQPVLGNISSTSSNLRNKQKEPASSVIDLT